MLENHKLKILFLITKSNWGGAQKYVFDLATNLNPEKFQIQIVLGGDGALVKKLQEKNQTRNGMEIEIIQIQNLQRDINIWKEINVFWQLLKIIWQEKPDILHLNSAKISGLGAVLGRIFLIKKIIFTCHGWAFNEERSWLQKKMIFYLSLITVLLSHQTICVSARVKQDLMNQIKINFLANFFKKNYFKNLEQKMQSIMLAIQETEKNNNQNHEFLCSKIDKSKINIITVAELHPIKGHDVAIQALEKLKRENPEKNFGQNFIYHIIGSGQEKKNLENLILRLQNTEIQNISPNITNVTQNKQQNYFFQQQNYFFHGHVSEISEYLPEFDLFLFTSQSESFGYVILEAALAGLPIITHNVGAAEEILKHYSNKKILNIYENNNLGSQKNISKEKQIHNLSLVLKEILEKNVTENEEENKENNNFLKKTNPEEIEVLKNKFNLPKMILETEKIYLNIK